MDALTSSKFLSATLARWAAAQGYYYKAVNATPSTGIISSIQQTFSATSGLFCIQNSAPATSNVFLFPDYLKLLVSVVDTTATAFQYLGVVDNTLRYSSGGTALNTVGTAAANNGPMNTRRRVVGTLPQASLTYGALTLAAEGSLVVRQSRGCVKANVAPFSQVNDEYYFAFGSSADAGAGSAKTAAASTPSVYRQNLGMVSIAPQGSFVLNAWFPAITVGFTAEVEVGWWEVPADPA
jgi:hypothetical protein